MILVRADAAAALRDARHSPVLWVAAACLSIAVNGSRGLPQYFLQAAPALALAFAVAAAWAWPHLRPVTRTLAIVAVVVATQRVVNVDKVVDYLRWDLSAWTGTRTRDEYLARFGARDSGDKYSALAVRELAQAITERVQPNETVLVLGFSPGALLQSERRSATRFFWSRPLIVGFGEGWPGYGVSGLLAELETNKPALVVLRGVTGIPTRSTPSPVSRATRGGRGMARLQPPGAVNFCCAARASRVPGANALHVPVPRLGHDFRWQAVDGADRR